MGESVKDLLRHNSVRKHYLFYKDSGFFEYAKSWEEARVFCLEVYWTFLESLLIVKELNKQNKMRFVPDLIDKKYVPNWLSMTRPKNKGTLLRTWAGDLSLLGRIKEWANSDCTQLDKSLKDAEVERVKHIILMIPKLEP
ncbi:hypothetical protein SAMN02745165_03550 [Malonomonas rubra DSM 5091]|uniref:Uncharacterized protein n=1 Tax=Malonomonas rubra DSM 5091 TaxID=1122189 RepID=A0A1M6NA69_MALRU|nr:hypothetical protein [Malonomonas rubra]SHJ92595.1 hypothetical protein SAMN02745165_03550 [Malonomonas rubra DSM 5091]